MATIPGRKGTGVGIAPWEPLALWDDDEGWGHRGASSAYELLAPREDLRRTTAPTVPDERVLVARAAAGATGQPPRGSPCGPGASPGYSWNGERPLHTGAPGSLRVRQPRRSAPRCSRWFPCNGARPKCGSDPRPICGPVTHTQGEAEPRRARSHVDFISLWLGRLQRSINQPARFAFVLILVAGSAIAILTPPLKGADEPDHFTRAYQLAGGDASVHKGGSRYGALLPSGYATGTGAALGRSESEPRSHGLLGPPRSETSNWNSSIHPGWDGRIVWTWGVCGLPACDRAGQGNRSLAGR